jgi:regulator of nucleoside diphosphate kinase
MSRPAEGADFPTGKRPPKRQPEFFIFSALAPRGRTHHKEGNVAPADSKRRKPAITISRSDHETLARLADAIAERNPAVAEELTAELDRARVVADASMRDDVVRMGSTLSYATDTGETRTVTLVFPAEADISAGRVSILTPIGAALIGLSPGQSIDWEARDGRVHRLTVESVERPAGAGGLQQAS